MPVEEKRKRMVVEEVVSEKAPEPVQPEPKVEVVKQAEPEVVEADVAKVEETKEAPETIEPDAAPEEQLPEKDHFTIQEPAVNSSTQPIIELKNSNATNPLVIIIPGIFLLGALLGGIYFYQKSIGTTNTPTSTPSSVSQVDTTPTPSAVPTETVDLTKYPINIMNGSGIVGEAGKVKTLVETAGFKVSKTGNAEAFDFTKTVIKAKADVPTGFLTQLTAALSKSYVLDTNQTLATSSADSVQVIVGTSKAK